MVAQIAKAWKSNLILYKFVKCLITSNFIHQIVHSFENFLFGLDFLSFIDLLKKYVCNYLNSSLNWNKRIIQSHFEKSDFLSINYWTSELLKNQIPVFCWSLKISGTDYVKNRKTAKPCITNILSEICFQVYRKFERLIVWQKN